MKKEEFEVLALDYLRGTLSGLEKEKFEESLGQEEFKNSFETLKETWQAMDTIKVPEPSQQMDNAFFSVLEKELEAKENTKVSLGSLLKELYQWLMKPQLAYGLLFLVLIGVYFFKNEDNIPGQETIVSKEEPNAQEELVLTLLDQPSANKRLQGVYEVKKMDKTTAAITNALFTTLNNDSNVNVRLAAVESLAKYVENPEVRMGLITSITNQESPIVQIALADLMVTLQEKESVKSIEELLEQPNLDSTVSKKLKESINQII